MTTQQVMRFANVTARQLQWWDEKGILRPYRRRNCRDYTPEQAALAKVIGELRLKNIGERDSKRALRAIAQVPGRRYLCVLAFGGNVNAPRRRSFLCLDRPEDIVKALAEYAGGGHVIELEQPPESQRA